MEIVNLVHLPQQRGIQIVVIIKAILTKIVILEKNHNQTYVGQL